MNRRLLLVMAFAAGALACLSLLGGEEPTVPGACTELSNSALVVAESRVAGSDPTRGGAVVSGVYHRTATVIYTGPGGATGPSGRWYQQTLRLTTTLSNTAVREELQSDFDGPEGRSAGTITLSGTALSTRPGLPVRGVAFVWLLVQR